MSILERGQAQREQAERERVEREAAERDRLQRRVARDFVGTFYKDRIVRNPKYTALGSEPRLIYDPKNPPPALQEFEFEGGGSMQDTSFTCEGIRYRCRWRYHSGGDRAYWDDGWWPDWYVLIERPRLFGLLSRIEEVKVGGPAGVAEAIT